MHSHHSHSGDYVAHATDTLEGIADRAIEMGFETFCLTEHMPRIDSKFLYPEEIEQNYGIETLETNFDKFYHHAKRLQKEKTKSGCKTHFLVGLEVEGIDEAHIEFAAQILEKYNIDMTVGSVHFVKQIPIDFNRENWELAKDRCGGIRGLFKEYFELQYKVLTKLKPLVVGHFDLIRLFSDDDDLDETTGLTLGQIELVQDWPEIWDLITRNLIFINSYGGIIEFNSAAIRKGWTTPYPKMDICQAVIQYCGSRFCLSDDSHAIAQVGLNYHKVKEYVNELKLKKLFYLDFDSASGKIEIKEKPVDDFNSSEFWSQYSQ